MNKQTLNSKVRHLAKERNISPTLLYIRFFFDAFLERLSISKYSNKFILKGGLYLSSIINIEKRATMDIDFLLRKMRLDQKILTDCVKEIISINLADEVRFCYLGSKPIRDEDLYGGLSIVVEGHFYNIRQKFSIDIVTGDPFIESQYKYVYKCLFNEKELALKMYSVESFLAEKLQTILARKENNSRSKDFYDVYILDQEFSENVSLDILRSAFTETCLHRGHEYGFEEAVLILKQIEESKPINIRWTAFARKMRYVGNISFKDTLVSCKKFISKICADNEITFLQ